MVILKKHRFEFLIFIFLSLAFFGTRIFRIETLPLFTDEAIYTRWSQIARYDAAWRFISLTDGKQPLFVWFDMVFMRFIKDPLLAGRAVSVMAGFFSMIGLFFLGREVFKNKWIGIITSLLYLIFPFALVYDRMALYDSLVGTFAIWVLYLEILLIRKRRLDIALILGMVLGLAVLTKTSGFFGIYLLPFSLLIIDLNNKKKLDNIFRWGGLAIISVILAYAYYSILRLSPFFHIISDKNSIFVYPIGEWVQHPFNFFWGNLLGVWDWFLKYTTWPIIILMFGSLFVARKYTREKLLLIVWFLAPFTALALFGRVLYPRFIFFMTLSLLPLVSLSIYSISQRVKNKWLFGVCFLLLVGLVLRSDYYILTDFARAPIPSSDLEQYINGWPAGGGVKEVVSFLQQESQKGKIYVATEGTFGSLPTYIIEIYLGDNKNVEKRGIWPLPPEIPKDLTSLAKKMPTFFIFNNSQSPPAGWPLRFIAKYQKGIGDSYMSLYQVEGR
ncbi:MAG: glycosyltransferase family 39 protein [Candidatus Levybacteria bacterium]|nr:glycosyltransferase family 39 protein [Candidatus Levybacteria bacterium]